MNFTEAGVFQKQQIRIVNLLPEIGIEQIRKEILQGLTGREKYISSKFFYDHTGSHLFEEITHQPEYYPTRTEKSILKQIAPELMNNGNSSMEVIELGSGDCTKISILFEAVEKPTLEHLDYLPLDVSESAIQKSAGELSQIYPYLKINGFVADFMHQLDEIPHPDKPRLICFFGSTIGNFNMEDAKKIMKSIAKGVQPGVALLVGFDLVKPGEILSAAYNDAKGITLKFNKNILNSVNHIIASDFKEDDFDHFAYFNVEKSRIEMHLIANKNCTVKSSFLGEPLHFKKGDGIHTENSNKFSVNDIEKLIEDSELKVEKIYTDPKNWFALVKFVTA
ncbi:MAG: L-histidine N(alpha)-methyltransferase [Prolixibacteraceae bacterium]